MSEAETIDAEVEDIEEIEDQLDDPSASIRELIKSIEDENYSSAEKNFTSMLGDRLGDALDQTKMKIADQIFNNAEPEEDDIDVDDEDIESLLDSELEVEEVDDEEESEESQE